MRVVRRSALLVAAVAALLAPAAVVAQDRCVVATAHFTRGRALRAAGDHAAALREFRDAQALCPSPNARFNIARSLYDLGRVDDAAREFELTEREAHERAVSSPEFQSTELAARDGYDAARARCAQLTLALAPPRHAVAGARPRVALDGRAVATELLAAGHLVAPGAFRLEVALAGHEPLTVVGQARERARVRVEVALAPRDATRGAMITAGAVATAVGLASVAAGAALAGASAGVYAGLRARCGPMGACPQPEADAVARGQALETAGNVALIAGGAVALAGAIVLTAGAARPAPRSRFTLQLGVAPGAGVHSSIGVRF